MKHLLLCCWLLLSSACAHPVKQEASKIPFRMHDNRILVPVFLNGKGPYSFIFDTGGARAHTINYSLAQELGLSLSAAPKQSGAGESRQQAWKALIQHYSISDLEVKNQNFDIIDLSTIQKAFGFERLDGIIGYDVLKKSVTCIDFEKRVLTFKNGLADCFGSTGITVPFRLEHDTPVIVGSVNGIATEFIVDTGDRSAFSLFQKFASKNHLDALFENQVEVSTGVGVGGFIKGRLQVLSNIQMGPITLNDVLSRLPSVKTGYFARSELGGSIGNEILRRFNIALDYSQHEITFVKNAHYNDAYRFTPPLDAF